MISTKTIVSDLADVPKEWVFENYLTLPESLNGQDVKIHSVFVKEKTPSMCVYIEGKVSYKYKDFSSGKGGDGIDLVVQLFNLPTRGAASQKIMHDYTDYISKNGHVVRSYVPENRYQVTDYEMRHWNTLDVKFWTDFEISSGLLKQYNVCPLGHYELSKDLPDGTTKTLTFKGQYIYGYFRTDGTLYKIYQPKQKEKKFLKLKDYTQGLDQLTYSTKYLLITSSLKDVMSFMKLGIKNIEAIAPDSENSMMPEAVMHTLKNKYHKICVAFDNDEAGIKAAKIYKQKYDLPYVVLDLDKDISDSVCKFGIEKTRNALLFLLKQELL